MYVNFCSYLEYDIQCDTQGFNVGTYIYVWKKRLKKVVYEI
jgi:hypothetical protein